MKRPLKLIVANERAHRALRLPYPDADHALADGPCPACGAVGDLAVAGTGRRIAQDDHAYEADAVALCCKKHVGTIRVEMNTLFGLREDEAVARMGARIY